MAPLTANLGAYTSRSTRISARASKMRMPHVFVIPPEEEQQHNPPWCCFDADEQLENNSNFPSNPDIHFLDVPYLLQQSEQYVPTPIARRTSVHQPRPRVPLSKKLEKKQHPEAVKIIGNKPSKTGKRDAQEDLDVIEVVKVKRGREALADLEENTKVKKVKRSETLRARATKALQSIKNVGKGSQRTHVKELWTSSESMPGTFKGMQEQIRSQQDRTRHRPISLTKKNSLSQGDSRFISQIFQPSRPESSFPVRKPSLVAPTEALYTLPAANTPSVPHLRHNNADLPLSEVPSTLPINDVLNISVSLTPSLKKNAKFSVRELHRLFSFSSSSLDDPSLAPTATMVPFSSARNISMPSTSDCPDVPMEEEMCRDARYPDPDGSANRKLASRYHQEFQIHSDDNFSTPQRLSDLSFEMRLDSLRFDSLSFDPEDFDVSMEGSIPR